MKKFTIVFVLVFSVSGLIFGQSAGTELMKIQSYQAPRNPVLDSKDATTRLVAIPNYDTRKKMGFDVPPTAVDAFICDIWTTMHIEQPAVNFQNLKLDHIKAALQFYVDNSQDKIRGYRSWAHWNFVRSLTSVQRDNLALDVFNFIKNNGVWDIDYGMPSLLGLSLNQLQSRLDNLNNANKILLEKTDDTTYMAGGFPMDIATTFVFQNKKVVAIKWWFSYDDNEREAYAAKRLGIDLSKATNNQKETIKTAADLVANDYETIFASLKQLYGEPIVSSNDLRIWGDNKIPYTVKTMTLGRDGDMATVNWFYNEPKTSILTSSEYSDKIINGSTYPIVLSNDGNKLYLLNTTDENFDVMRGSVPLSVVTNKSAFELSPVILDKVNYNWVYLVTGTIDAKPLADNAQFIGSVVFFNKNSMDQKLITILPSLIGMQGLGLAGPEVVDKPGIACLGRLKYSYVDYEGKVFIKANGNIAVAEKITDSKINGKLNPPPVLLSGSKSSGASSTSSSSSSTKPQSEGSLSDGSSSSGSSAPAKSPAKPKSKSPDIDFNFAWHIGLYANGLHENTGSLGVPLQLGVEMGIGDFALDLLGEASAGSGYPNLLEYRLGGMGEVYFFDRTFGLGLGYGLYNSSLNLGSLRDSASPTEPVPTDTMYLRLALIFRRKSKFSLYAEHYNDDRWGFGFQWTTNNLK